MRDSHTVPTNNVIQEEYDILLATYGTTTVGFTLSRAWTQLGLDPPWTRQMVIQFRGRIDRAAIVQKAGHTYVYFFLMEGATMEERVIESHTNRALFDQLTQAMMEEEDKSKGKRKVVINLERDGSETAV